jgi:hypothetical protein
MKCFLAVFGLAIAYMTADLIGEAGLAVKHDHIHTQFMLMAASENWDSCEANRLLRAEIRITADMGFNAFREIRQWNHDYLADEIPCVEKK